MDWLAHVFGLVCGQNPAHTWAPGGVVLPCCQRCTGLYAGAAVAILLQLWLRPRPTSRFLQLHGLFLLQMVPFGFHWLPQGPVIRTVTGLLFGYGVVAFLFCLPRARWGGDRSDCAASRNSQIEPRMPGSRRKEADQKMWRRTPTIEHRTSNDPPTPATWFDVRFHRWWSASLGAHEV